MCGRCRLVLAGMSKSRKKEKRKKGGGRGGERGKEEGGDHLRDRVIHHCKGHRSLPADGEKERKGKEEGRGGKGKEGGMMCRHIMRAGLPGFFVNECCPRFLEGKEKGKEKRGGGKGTEGRGTRSLILRRLVIEDQRGKGKRRGREENGWAAG